MISLFGKIFIFLGCFFILIGILFSFFEKIPYFGKLPGDIYIKKENFSFYFPLTTSLILSFFLSLILYLISRFLK
jgi:hypothetical protein